MESKHMTKTTRPWPLLVLGLGMTALIAGIAAAPARADDDDWRHREWREHERREHERHERQVWCAHHPYDCGAPSYVYAPPPVVYTPPPPPPVVYAPPSLNIVVPIHIK
jgi:hypothetical protein